MTVMGAWGPGIVNGWALWQHSSFGAHGHAEECHRTQFALLCLLEYTLFDLVSLGINSS